MNAEGEVLLTKQHQNKPHPNLWECPDESVLAGEDSLEGAIREIKEEIGIVTYYNHKRIKAKLKGMSPVQYRIHAQKAA
jgi:ADP-ribose pyrophosphatase YjhB (NUDIX family)